jgi:hypothetical protein
MNVCSEQKKRKKKRTWPKTKNPKKKVRNKNKKNFFLKFDWP